MLRTAALKNSDLLIFDSVMLILGFVWYDFSIGCVFLIEKAACFAVAEFCCLYFSPQNDLASRQDFSSA